MVKLYELELLMKMIQLYLQIPANKISDREHTITVKVTGDDNFTDGEASTKFIKESDPDSIKSKPFKPDSIDPVNNDKISNNPVATATMKKQEYQ